MIETASHDPRTIGLAEAPPPAPCTLIIFGASGDLSKRKLLPALYNLGLDGLLPERFAVLGIARREMGEEAFRAMAKGAIEEHSRRPLEPGRWGAFGPALDYVSGAIDDPDTYQQLKRRLATLEPAFGIPGNRIFYLSIPPGAIEACVRHLNAAGLVMPPEQAGAFSRVIVEKPIGRDLDSARRINATLCSMFDDRQVFRIDHYLGKETVQNILVMRFGNAIFEPLWNHRHIDHVQITVAEENGVGTRGNYYEQAGALRDMVQNHILQLLSLVAMEPPWAITADVIRDHKLEVLNCLRPITGADVADCAVRAQYGPGNVHGAAVPGYRREKGVAPDSTTETYVALKLLVDNWRWAGVPFFVRNGKRLPKRATEIAVQFKEVPPILFNVKAQHSLEPNVLTLRIQPNEGLSLRIGAKLPGPRVRIHPVEMDFRYGTIFGAQSPEAYERLLLDVMAGDATLFMRRDEVEASWTWITNILEAWAQSGARWLPEYAAGTWGPVEAERLIETGDRRWRVL
ncbi:MAG: glucose-6-phosphate dehydrogenase [Gammaproteobacteria bacterium]